MTSPDRRRQRGRATGTAVLIVLVSLLVTVWVLPASAQELTDSPTPTESPSPAPSPTEPPTFTQTAPPQPQPTASPTGGWSMPGSGASSSSSGGLSLPGPPGNGGGAAQSTLAPTGPLEARYQRKMTPLENPDDWRGWKPGRHWGSYNTSVLDKAARKHRKGGWSESRIAREIYAPFIVVGPAAWSNSWGAPRYVGGYHPHHGQDVLCPYGAPVIAVDDGTIAYGTDTLGGLVAYLQQPDGSFWYYAHLSAYGPRFETGDAVRKGAVIGKCGASGDATVPHVHFAYFTAAHEAVDPMSVLVGWLSRAERRLPGHHDDPKPEVEPLVVAKTRPAVETPLPDLGDAPLTVEMAPAEPIAASEPEAPELPTRPVGAAGGVLLLGLAITWVGRWTTRRLETA